VVAAGPWPGLLALGPAPVGEHDPETIAEWGASRVLGLTTSDEAAAIGQSDLAGHLATAGLLWTNAPVVDYMPPDERFERVWPAIREEIIGRLEAGQRVLVHCRAGRGRSGAIVAALLVAGGMLPDAAIAAVRVARPGAIETAGQETWVRRLAAQTGAGSQFGSP